LSVAQTDNIISVPPLNSTNCFVLASSSVPNFGGAAYVEVTKHLMLPVSFSSAHLEDNKAFSLSAALIRQFHR